MSQPKIRISLRGSLRVTGKNGEVCTPKSMKAQALLALLATGKDFRRPRIWLQDRLWSERAPKQASGSLRQALHELRRCLGDASDILVAERNVVQLQPDQVEVDTLGDAESVDTEFLMGIDVKDPEFEDWLARMRVHYANKSTPADPLQSHAARKRLAISFSVSGNANPDLMFLETIFVDIAKRAIGEVFDVDFTLNMAELGPRSQVPPADLLIRVQCIETFTSLRWIRASMDMSSNLQTLWSDQIELGPSDPMTPENMGCLSLTHRLVGALSEAMLNSRVVAAIQNGKEPDVLAASALRKMFTMREDEITAAELLLRRALEEQPRGLYHAWYAQVISIRHVEQQSRDVAAMKEESEERIAYALETEPMNSNVLASAANARLIFNGDTLQSAALAQQAVSLNRSNPLAWWSWSNVNLYAGTPEVAYASALTAQALGAKSSVEFWTAFQRALAAAVRGRFEEALSYSALSSALAPSFRPPLRYMIGVATKMGRINDAVSAMKRLEAIETDFSVHRMINDPDYPVSMMRRANLIDTGQLSQLFPA